MSRHSFGYAAWPLSLTLKNITQKARGGSIEFEAYGVLDEGHQILLTDREDGDPRCITEIEVTLFPEGARGNFKSGMLFIDADVASYNGDGNPFLMVQVGVPSPVYQSAFDKLSDNDCTARLETVADIVQVSVVDCHHISRVYAIRRDELHKARYVSLNIS